MDILTEIKDGESPILKIREASRAILFDENSLIPLLFVSKYHYHKLPGGGIEDNESKEKALIREIKEETGSTFESIGEIGQITEFRSKWNLKQTSYCYLGKITSKGTPDFTEKELNQGFKLIWLSLDNAILQFEKDLPCNYEGTFIQKRDLTFLKKARDITHVLLKE